MTRFSFNSNYANVLKPLMVWSLRNLGLLQNKDAGLAGKLYQLKCTGVFSVVWPLVLLPHWMVH
jgi:hypothetical protein